MWEMPETSKGSRPPFCMSMTMRAALPAISSRTIPPPTRRLEGRLRLPPGALRGASGFVPTFISMEAEKRGGPGAHVRGPPGLLSLRVAAPSFPRTAGTSRTRPPGGHHDRGRERNPRCSPGVMYVPFVSAVLRVRNDAVALWTDTHQALDPLPAATLYSRATFPGRKARRRA